MAGVSIHVYSYVYNVYTYIGKVHVSYHSLHTSVTSNVSTKRLQSKILQLGIWCYLNCCVLLSFPYG